MSTGITKYVSWLNEVQNLISGILSLHDLQYTKVLMFHHFSATILYFSVKVCKLVINNVFRNLTSQEKSNKYDLKPEDDLVDRRKHVKETAMTVAFS